MSQNNKLIDKVQPQATVDYMDVDKAGGTNDANAVGSAAVNDP